MVRPMPERVEDLLRSMPDLTRVDYQTARAWFDHAYTVLDAIAPVEAHILRIYQPLLLDEKRRELGVVEIVEVLQLARDRVEKSKPAA
jgi:hypothetical protein